MAWVTKYKSLRFRLTVWNIVAFMTVTLLVFFGFYVVTSKILSIHTDNLLRSHSAGVINLITGNSIGMHSMLTREAFNREFTEIPGMLVVAMDNRGQIFNASVTLNRDAASFGDLFAQVYNGQKSFFADKNIGGSQMRFLATPIFDKDILQGVVLVAHPIDVISKSLDSLIIVLGVTFMILIFPVSLGGYLLIKKAIGPIGIMTDKLKKISSENLDTKISVPQTGDEIQELAETFNLLLDRLHLAFTRERQFIGDIAHELKTPLATIKTTIEIVKDKPKILNEILLDVDKLITRLKNILDLAWSESLHTKTFEKIDLSELLLELKDITVKLATPKNITVNSKITPNITILGKSDKLGQAILNILENAIKFTPNNGNISLGLSLRDNLALINIKDNGVGISTSDLSHIFERFYRGTKTTKTLGSGLGLAISDSIIRAHHGEIKVESKVGKGSTFSIYLPLS